MVWKSVVRGLRAVVYRPAQIVTPGTGQLPHDLFGHVMRACRTPQGGPGNLEAKIDFGPVKFARLRFAAFPFRNPRLAEPSTSSTRRTRSEEIRGLFSEPRLSFRWRTGLRS